MSGEFGSYNSGYFHTQIWTAADDLECGRDALTREWGKFFRKFGPIADAISYSEANDSGPDYPIRETLTHIANLKAILTDIESHVRVYRDVADAAVREHIKASKS